MFYGDIYYTASIHEMSVATTVRVLSFILFIHSYLLCEQRKFESMTASACSDNIKTDLKETGWETEDWIKLADIFQQSNGRIIQFFKVWCRVI